MANVLVVSGVGAYGDPWHPLPETSATLADLIAAVGHTVAITDQVEPALSDLTGVDLVVVNVGCPRPARPSQALEPVSTGLSKHLAAGGGLLGIHVSATSFTTMAEWPAILGGHWVRGTSMHPDQDQAQIRIADEAHPITTGLSDFTAFDERYSYLRLQPDVVVLGRHEHDNEQHPILWAHEHLGARVVYDGLGHDTSSYQSPGHIRFVERSVAWTLREI